jgi:hypothetical protein
MALPTRPTLVQLRESLLARVGLASDAAVPSTVIPVVDERLRQAQVHLLAKFDMTHLWTIKDFPLTPGTSVYDWPDKVEVGDLKRISVVRAEDGWEWELKPGMRPEERNILFPSPSTDPTAWGTPRLYTVQNQVIRIGPAPDESWASLRMEYFQAGTQLVDDGDVCSADPEALLLKAEILVRLALGMQGIQDLERNLKDYLLDLSAKQGDGDGFQMGGRQSIRNQPQIRNRATDPVRGLNLGAGEFGRHLSW